MSIWEGAFLFIVLYIYMKEIYFMNLSKGDVNSNLVIIETTSSQHTTWFDITCLSGNDTSNFLPVFCCCCCFLFVF